MPTLQDAVGAVEERLFVGRERERVTFRCWLRADTEPPEILNVIGPSGVGKTALLHEFRRIAAQDGRPTVMLLGRDLDPPSGGLPASARGGHATAATAHAQEAALLLMVDALEEPSLPRQGLDALLSTLDCRVKLLIAGRHPLHVVLESESLLLRLVREVPLCGLSPEEARTYLERRGLSEPHAVGAILDATGGYPLALSLAADMASRGSAPDFEMGSAWRLTAHSLVTRLIPEGGDARLRTLLDIGAVVRQFDETTLAAVSGDGEPEAREEFDQLCSVAVFEPAEHGLRLRPDVRPLVGQDLRWRRPHRHAQIRDRALAHYRERSCSASAAERGWLVADRLFLCENPPLRRRLFPSHDVREVRVSTAVPEDRSEILSLQERWAALVGLPPADRAADRTWLQHLLSQPEARIRLCRDRDGAALGFSAALSLHRDCIEPILGNAVHAPAVRAHLAGKDAGSPEAREDGSFVLLSHPWCSEADVATTALTLDVIGMLTGGGVYLAVPVLAEDEALLEALGFVRVPGCAAAGTSRAGCEGFVLDLPEAMVEPWIAGLVTGDPPPRVLRGQDLARELHAALVHWHDDEWLATCPLSALAAASFDGGDVARADVIRNVVRHAIDRARGRAHAGEEIVYRALELAYLERGISHEGAAERLAVSRSTFFRLLRRGIRELAATMSDQQREPIRH